MPLKAEDIRSGDVIKFSRPGGKISKGNLYFLTLFHTNRINKKFDDQNVLILKNKKNPLFG